MAEISGKTVSRISETMRFIGLSEKIKDDFRQRKLTQQHGAELLRLPSQELQDKVVDKIQKKEMTVKQTREAVNKLLAKLASKADPANDHADEPGSVVQVFPQGHGRLGLLQRPLPDHRQLG